MCARCGLPGRGQEVLAQEPAGADRGRGQPCAGWLWGGQGRAVAAVAGRRAGCGRRAARAAFPEPSRAAADANSLCSPEGSAAVPPLCPGWCLSCMQQAVFACPASLSGTKEHSCVFLFIIVCMKVSIESGIPFSFEQGMRGPEAIVLKRRKVTGTEIVTGICDQNCALLYFSCWLWLSCVLIKNMLASWYAFCTDSCLRALLVRGSAGCASAQAADGALRKELQTSLFDLCCSERLKSANKNRLLLLKV